VNHEIEVGAFADPLNQSINGTGREWSAALGLEHECAGRISLEFA
jgi:hypothetical protein